MRNICKKDWYCKTFIILGLAAFIVGVLADGVALRDLRLIGMMIFVGAAARLAIKPATKPHVDMYQAGHEAGYDLGFHDGHQSARPVVVPIRRFASTDDLERQSHN